MTSTLQQIVALMPRSVKVGDFFYRSWGYDQTNVNFYQVVGFTASGKSMRLREVGKTVVTAPGRNGRDVTGVVPVRGRFVDREKYTKRIQMSYDGTSPCAAWNSYSSLSLHDGYPQFDTNALGYSGH